MNGILDALSKHSMFSETLDTLNRDPLTAHQMKGFDFAKNFPGAVPGGVYTPTSFLGPILSKGYQYGQELSRAMLDGLGGVTIGDALSKAGIQSDANIKGMQKKGFDMDTYKQNLQDFNIDNVTFANSFGIPTLKNKFANIGKTISDAVISPLNAYEFNPNEIQSKINAAKNREELNRIGLLAFDDAGLTLPDYEEFAQKAKPGFNLNFAKQLGSGALGILTGNPFIGLLARGIGALGSRTNLPGIRGGIDLQGDTGLDTFRRSTSLADFFQRRRDQKARDEAAKIGAMKQAAQNLDYEYDAYVGGNGGGGGGFSGPSPGSQGPGGSDEMGSF